MASDQEQLSGVPAEEAGSDGAKETLLEQARLRRHAAALGGPLASDLGGPWASGLGGLQELGQATGQRDLRENALPGLQESGQHVTAREDIDHEAFGSCVPEADLVCHASASQALVMNLADVLLGQNRPEAELEPETQNEAVVCRMDCVA